MDKVKRLNEKGIEKFENFIMQLSEDGALPVPYELLDEHATSEPLEIEILVDKKIIFETRYAMGRYLCEQLSHVNSQQILGERGVWSWLALYWFEQLCPPDSTGLRKPRKSYNYILSRNWNHRPRHALFTTWMLVDNHGENSLFMLSKKPSERGELIEQLAARQYYMSCHGVIETASEIYLDKKKGTFKKGCTSRNRKGNIRRFITYLQQLDLTYDLGTITSKSLLSILPPEYESFLE